MCVLSRCNCIQLFATLWTVACQAPLWDSVGKNTGMGRHALIQGIFLTHPGTIQKQKLRLHLPKEQGELRQKSAVI